MDVESTILLRTLAKRGLLAPGRPSKVSRQLRELRRWGYSLAGELRSAAIRDPRRIAAIDDVGAITYRDLAERSGRLANALRAAYGLGPGDRIGLLCRNSIPMLEALAAISAIGADAVLVNTGLGPGQLEGVLLAERVRMLFHDDEFYELLSAVPPSVERVSADGNLRRATPTIAGLVNSAPDDDLTPPARLGRTIVLTSGTTGAPKGAPRPLPGGFGPLVSVISRIPLGVGDRIFISSPLFHTWGYTGLQIALALRGTVVLRRRFDPVDTLKAIQLHECSALLAVPVMLQWLLDVAPQGRFVSSLNVVASSGAALPAPVVGRFMDAFGDVLYNLYGSTEAGVASIATPGDLRRDPTCAGRPADRTRVVVVDPQGRPLPPDHVGRIFVGSDMLFDGYTNGDRREVLEGLMTTGDIGHLSADGLLFVDGREDDMVISGGENIYPAAVENLIAELPQVREVAVIGVSDREWGQRLAAYIVLYPGEYLDVDGVREYVRRGMARFSVPREVHFVPELPRNATGKVVRRFLRPGDTGQQPVIPPQRVDPTAPTAFIPRIVEP
jgi:acyl-CoA synthetase (AMP-forming)/AMP-acid ligase II